MIERIIPIGRKWIGETDARGVMERSAPKSSRKQVRIWLDEKVVDAMFGDETERLMSAAIVKGLVEHNDGMRFFGSTMAYTYHLENAIKRGYVTESKSVTALGREWYERCLKQLPQTRQVFWTSGVGLPSKVGDKSISEQSMAVS